MKRFVYTQHNGSKIVDMLLSRTKSRSYEVTHDWAVKEDQLKEDYHFTGYPVTYGVRFKQINHTVCSKDDHIYITFDGDVAGGNATVLKIGDIILIDKTTIYIIEHCRNIDMFKSLVCRFKYMNVYRR